MAMPWPRSGTRATPIPSGLQGDPRLRRQRQEGDRIRKQFGGPPYGWPQDAIDAALIVLFNAGHVQARSGTEVSPRASSTRRTSPPIEFRVETITLTKVQLIALRSLFKAIGLNTQPNQESVHAPEFLDRMIDAGRDRPGAMLRYRSGPTRTTWTDLANRVGNDQLKAIHDAKDRLTHEIADWQKRKEKIEQRQPCWTTLQAL